MKRSKFTDEQIVAIVKEGEAGRKVADVCRTNGITAQTFYRWKATYGGLELSDVQRLRQARGRESPTETDRGRADARPARDAGGGRQTVVAPSPSAARWGGWWRRTTSVSGGPAGCSA